MIELRTGELLQALARPGADTFRDGQRTDAFAYEPGAFPDVYLEPVIRLYCL